MSELGRRRIEGVARVGCLAGTGALTVSMAGSWVVAVALVAVLVAAGIAAGQVEHWRRRTLELAKSNYTTVDRRYSELLEASTENRAASRRLELVMRQRVAMLEQESETQRRLISLLKRELADSHLN